MTNSNSRLLRPTTIICCRACIVTCILTTSLLVTTHFSGCAVQTSPSKQTTAAPEVRAHEHYEPQEPVCAKKWKKVKPGLHGSFASIDEHYPRNIPPTTKGPMSFSGTAWRGERIYAQILLWTSNGANQVRLSSTPLLSKDGKKLPASTLHPAFMRYVLSDDGSQGCKALTPDTPRMLVPDIIDTAEVLDIDPQNTRPVWLAMDVPQDASLANYTGQLTVSYNSGSSLAFEINLEVLPLILPEPSKWSFHLDLWQNPWAVARYHNVRPWSKEHWLLLEPLLKTLADAGQKCITATIVHAPWGGQTYDPYGSMVEWTRGVDGNWTFDYTVFDQYVELCDRCGITEQISCYTMVPWGLKCRYYDAASASYQTLIAQPGTAAYKNHWKPFLTDFAEHLNQKGWLKRTAIAMDERDLPSMRAVIDLVKTAAPQLKVAMAGHYFPSINDDVHNLCIYIAHIDPNTPEAITVRRQQKQITTFYVCCSNDKPNNFTYSPPAENTWMGYYAAAMGLDGNLRWAFNSWTADPLYDTRHVTFQAGDCFFVYPGPRSSIRFERLREGIQD
ncbi:MAG: DUF4091 domain-containing protein, partial [Planctomycetota bacterium]